jgi:DNA-binding winged helix-turn-helix (wHTH) protein
MSVSSNQRQSPSSNRFCRDLLMIDLDDQTAWFGSTRVVLTHTEIKVLFVLASSAENIVNRSMVARLLTTPLRQGSRVVDMHVHRLRLKLAYACGDSVQIETVYRLGYRLHVAESAFDIAPKLRHVQGRSRRESTGAAVVRTDQRPDPHVGGTMERTAFNEPGMQ